MGWLKNRPGDSDSFANVPTIAQDNFDVIEDIIGEEHYTLGEALCGTHIPGVAGFAKSGTTTIIGSLTSPGSGAIAWDYTLGCWKRYWDSAWAIPGSATKWSRVRAYLNSNQALTAVDGGTQVAQIEFNAEDYDSLSEFSSSAFSATDAGEYLVVSSWSACGAQTGGSAPSIGILILKNDTVVASATKNTSQPAIETDEQIKIVEILSLGAGDTIKIQARKTITNDMIIAGSDATYVSIHRLGSQCM